MERTSTLAGFVLLAALLAGGRCEEDVKTKELVARIQSEITIGMTRAEAEARLAAVPIEYHYVSRKSLELLGEASFEGKPLSGRLQIHTPYEQGFMRLTWATADIDLDEEERVVSVRVQKGFTGL